jgi:serine phosphatase RsbU (regulator of sigma subunit)
LLYGEVRTLALHLIMKKQLAQFIFIYSVVFVCFPSKSQAQNKQIDSLKQILKTAKEDTNTLHVLDNLVWRVSNDSALVYANAMQVLASKLKFKKGIAWAYNDIANVYDKQGNARESLKNHLSALKIRQEIGDKTRIANSYNYIGGDYQNLGNYPEALKSHFAALKIRENLGDKVAAGESYWYIGNIYASESNLPKALENYFKSLKVFEEANHKWGLGMSYNNIGNIYNSQRDYQQGLEYYFKSLKLWEEIGDKFWIASCNANIGGIYKEQLNYAKAMEHYLKSFKIAKEIGDENGIGRCYNDIGCIYRDQSNYIMALDYFLKSLRILTKSGDKISLGICYGSLGSVYTELKEYKKAIQYFDSSLQLNKEVKNMDNERNVYLSLSGIYSKTNRYKEAFEYHLKYQTLTDSIFSSDNTKKLNVLAGNYTAEKREAEQARLDAIAVQEKRNQQIIIVAVSIGLLLVIIFAGFMFNRFKVTKKQKQIIELKELETQKQKHLIEEKNLEITDSINYAKRIQSSILPPLEEINSSLPQSFVLFKPKDIVSGDFYWFAEQHNKIFIAAADCTGHGVPGAFMSMLNSEKLSEAVELSSDVSKILQLVNIGLKKALRQSDKQDSTRDGMDIALLSFNRGVTNLEYAGANRPLWIVRNGKNEIEETKATKVAIGGLTEDDQEFTKHTFDLQKGDTIYIFSDGYADQFSPADKKLMTKKFKENILEIQNQTMAQQKQFLEKFINNWKAGMEQTDDILVIGVRV